MNRAVIYARYSADKQQDQSIDGQLRVCREYAKKNSLQIINTYIDRAISGKTDDRYEFLQMIKDSYKDIFDYVIVYKLDRFSRNKYDSAVHTHTLRKNGVKRLSATEPISDSPEGVLMESLLEGIAEYYSLELAQKVNRGIRENLIKGNWIGGVRTFGYNIKNKKPQIDDIEAGIVNRIFEMYSNGLVQREIQAKLSLLGYDFSSSKIYHILRNKKYIGIFEHHDDTYYNIFEQIVSNDLFNNVQLRLSKNKKAPAAKKAKVPYYLIGKLYCGNCEKTMIADSGTSRNSKVYNYYSCNKHRGHVCKTKPVGKDYIENLVGYLVATHILNKDVLEPIIEKTVAVYNKEIQDDSNIRMLKKNRSRLANQINNIIDAIKNGLLSEKLKNELSQLENQIDQLDHEIAKELSKNPDAISKELVMRLFDYYVKNKEHKEFTEFLLDAFISKVIWYPNDDLIRIIINSSEDNIFDINVNEIGSILSSNGVPKDNKSNYVIYKGYIIFTFNIDRSI